MSDPLSDDARRVVDTLEALRSAVRQRQGELATEGEADAMRALLRELLRRVTIEEPRPLPRKSIGSRISAKLRMRFFRLAFRWHARDVWKQQNEWNKLAATLLQDLVENERDRADEVARLRAIVEELSRKLEDGTRA